MSTRQQKFREKHPGYDREWYAKNREKCNEASRKSYRKHHKEQLERSRIKRETRDPEKAKQWARDWQKTARGIYKYYRAGAKARGVTMGLSFEEFEVLLGKPCEYCGEKAKGVDRVDNKKGYTKKNSVPCCKVCNHMKSNRSRAEFLEHCKKVAHYKKK